MNPPFLGRPPSQPVRRRRWRGVQLKQPDQKKEVATMGSLCKEWSHRIEACYAQRTEHVQGICEAKREESGNLSLRYATMLFWSGDDRRYADAPNTCIGVQRKPNAHNTCKGRLLAWRSSTHESSRSSTQELSTQRGADSRGERPQAE